MALPLVGGAFSFHRKMRPMKIKALRGGTLGAGVDGCRSNRASARECALAHSFSSVAGAEMAERVQPWRRDVIAKSVFFYAHPNDIHKIKPSYQNCCDNT